MNDSAAATARDRIERGDPAATESGDGTGGRETRGDRSGGAR